MFITIAVGCDNNVASCLVTNGTHRTYAKGNPGVHETCNQEGEAWVMNPLPV
jgi:hypothetical protein